MSDEIEYRFISMGLHEQEESGNVLFGDGVVYFAKGRVNGELYGCLLTFTPEFIADTEFDAVSREIVKQTLIETYKEDHPALDTAPDLMILL